MSETVDITGKPAGIRLFSALPVPAEFRKAVGMLPRKGLTDARWTHPDDLHITLRFLGDIEPGREKDVEKALQGVRRPSFHVDIAGLGSFEGKRQTVLWAAVQSTRKLTALAGEINEKLAPLGFEMPVKPFVPHVTLARLKSAKGLDTYIDRHRKALSARWQAHSFGLYLSGQPDEKGSRYKTLAEFSLQR